MIETYLLEYLNAFEKEGTLLKASQKLNISQPSLSRAMKKLEDELGIEIFYRKGNSISLNENGKIMLDYSKQILSIQESMISKAKEIKNNNKLIKTGMTAPGPMFYVSLLSASNRINITISKEDELIKDLKNRKLDLIFINSNLNDNDLCSSFLMREELYFSVPKNHFLAGMKNGVYFKEADGQSFLISNNLGFWNDILAKYLPKSKLFSQNMNDLPELISSSTIPSFVTNITKGYHSDKERVLIEILDEDAKVNFYAACRKEDKELLSKLF